MGQSEAKRLRPRSRVSENGSASTSRVVTLAVARDGDFHFGDDARIAFRATYKPKWQVPATDCLMRCLRFYRALEGTVR